VGIFIYGYETWSVEHVGDFDAVLNSDIMVPESCGSDPSRRKCVNGINRQYLEFSMERNMDNLSVWKSTGQTPQAEARGTLSAFVSGGNNGLLIPGPFFFRGVQRSGANPQIEGSTPRFTIKRVMFRPHEALNSLWFIRDIITLQFQIGTTSWPTKVNPRTSGISGNARERGDGPIGSSAPKQRRSRRFAIGPSECTRQIFT
jgi:hypothetical protein